MKGHFPLVVCKYCEIGSQVDVRFRFEFQGKCIKIALIVVVAREVNDFMFRLFPILHLDICIKWRAQTDYSVYDSIVKLCLVFEGVETMPLVEFAKGEPDEKVPGWIWARGCENDEGGVKMEVTNSQGLRISQKRSIRRL